MTVEMSASMPPTQTASLNTPRLRHCGWMKAAYSGGKWLHFTHGGLPAIVATGGIATGRGLAAVLAAGATAAQVGTAFMLCPEAGTSPAHREALNLAIQKRGEVVFETLKDVKGLIVNRTVTHEIDDRAMSEAVSLEQAVALLLASAPAHWSALPPVPTAWHRGVQALSKMSYSVFLIHYAVSLLVSALVTAMWPTGVLANGLGMLLALLGAIVAGAGLYRIAERPSQGWPQWAWALGGFMASVALARAMSG